MYPLPHTSSTIHKHLTVTNLQHQTSVTYNCVRCKNCNSQEFTKRKNHNKTYLFLLGMLILEKFFCWIQEYPKYSTQVSMPRLSYCDCQLFATISTLLQPSVQVCSTCHGAQWLLTQAMLVASTKSLCQSNTVECIAMTWKHYRLLSAYNSGHLPTAMPCTAYTYVTIKLFYSTLMVSLLNQH